MVRPTRKRNIDNTSEQENANTSNSNTDPNNAPSVTSTEETLAQSEIFKNLLQDAVESEVRRRIQNLKINNESTQDKWLQLDRQFATNLTVRPIQDHEKLTGYKNYKTWVQMLQLDLQAMGLISFLEEDYPEDLNVSQAKKEQLNALALTVIKSSVAKNISSNVTTRSAYQAFCQIKTMYEPTQMLQDVDLFNRMQKLRFKFGYDQHRFVADFERIITDYRDRGVQFDDSFLAAMFLNKINGIRNPNSPYFVYFGTVTALPEEQQTLDFIKHRFLQITPPMKEKDNSKDKRFRSDWNKLNSKKRPAPQSSTEENSSKRFKAGKSSDGPQSPYTEEQRAKMRTMTSAEKEKAKCAKCHMLFHSKDECPNPGPVCFRCFGFGHIGKKCPNPQFGPPKSKGG